MRLCDIEEQEGILTATVAEDEKSNLRVKTKAGLRTLPIHPTLIKLGFEEYIRILRRNGSERVFQGIKLAKRKAGAEAGKWFNERYRTKYISEDFKRDKKTLYSFRHTYITAASHSAKMRLDYIQQMVGHEKSQLGATKHYDKGASIKQLYEEASKLSFPDLELDQLSGQWKDLAIC
jgi:integrase